MKQGRRLLAQFGFFLLQNPFVKNFYTGKIYQGDLKLLCTPGLNCYSCPAAAVSCPIGAAQFFFAGVKSSISLYIAGFLALSGVMFGRFICSYVCPMGLLQDLLYRIKTSKLVLRLRFLRYVKYIILLVFVILLPMLITHDLTEMGEPWFCKYICPSGTIFGAVPLLLVNDFLLQMAGSQFLMKAIVAGALLAFAVFIYRFFCRVLCPLGAIYALFNKVSLLHFHCDKEKCVSCASCSKVCHIMIEPHKEPNSPECVRCGKCLNACKSNALTVKFVGVKGRVKQS